MSGSVGGLIELAYPLSEARNSPNDMAGLSFTDEVGVRQRAADLRVRNGQLQIKLPVHHTGSSWCLLANGETIEVTTGTPQELQGYWARPADFGLTDFLELQRPDGASYRIGNLGREGTAIRVVIPRPDGRVAVFLLGEGDRLIQRGTATWELSAERAAELQARCYKQLKEMSAVPPVATRTGGSNRSSRSKPQGRRQDSPSRLYWVAYGLVRILAAFVRALFNILVGVLKATLKTRRRRGLRRTRR